MVKIEALCSINSGQYDKGDIFETTPVAAQELIKAGHACPVLAKKPDGQKIKEKKEVKN